MFGSVLQQAGCDAVQIGDLRGLGGLALLLWHELELKLGIYSAKVTGMSCSPSERVHMHHSSGLGACKNLCYEALASIVR